MVAGEKLPLKHRLRQGFYYMRHLDGEFQPRKVQKAVGYIQQLLGSIEPRRPASYDLNESFRVLRTAWETQRRLDAVPWRHLRRGPYVLFYGSDPVHLGADVGFVREYIRVVRARKPPSTTVIVALLREFLYHYPLSAPSFDEYRESLEQLLLLEAPSTRLWRQRAQHYSLLERDGPKRFAFIWKSAPDTAHILGDAGLTGQLARCGFLREVQREALAAIQQELSAQHCGVHNLERVFALLEHEGQLRFDSDRGQMADALLLPFRSETPAADVKESIMRFLLRHLRHPQLEDHRWIGASQDAKNVMLRWLVGQTLEAFFWILDQTAKDAHWRYRRAFWRAYLDRDVIKDAWIVLGSRARELARSRLPELNGHYGLLRGVGGNQSVLLLRISGTSDLIIAEWSHDGACRIWESTSELRPRLYEKEYTRADLATGEAYDHRGSEKGAWQEKISRIIYKHTFIHVRPSEYMPRDDYLR